MKSFIHLFLVNWLINYACVIMHALYYKSRRCHALMQYTPHTRRTSARTHTRTHTRTYTHAQTHARTQTRTQPVSTIHAAIVRVCVCTYKDPLQQQRGIKRKHNTTAQINSVSRNSPAYLLFCVHTIVQSNAHTHSHSHTHTLLCWIICLHCDPALSW